MCIGPSVCVCVCVFAVIQYLSRNMTDLQLSQQQQIRQQTSAGLFEMSTANTRPTLVCTGQSIGICDSKGKLRYTE